MPEIAKIRFYSALLNFGGIRAFKSISLCVIDMNLLDRKRDLCHGRDMIGHSITWINLQKNQSGDNTF